MRVLWSILRRLLFPAEVDVSDTAVQERLLQFAYYEASMTKVPPALVGAGLYLWHSCSFMFIHSFTEHYPSAKRQRKSGDGPQKKRKAQDSAQPLANPAPTTNKRSTAEKNDDKTADNTKKQKSTCSLCCDYFSNEPAPALSSVLQQKRSMDGAEKNAKKQRRSAASVAKPQAQRAQRVQPSANKLLTLAQQRRSSRSRKPQQSYDDYVSDLSDLDF